MTSSPEEGIILVDKPAGVTSHDVVAAVRRAHRGVKVGHSGTLDPFATGLLIILLGKTCKLQNRFMTLPKCYETLAHLGFTSTTGDTEGELEHTGRLPDRDLILPTGEVRQRPPAYSAIKIDGVRAYKRARRGEQLVMPERMITVYRFEEIWRQDDQEGAEGHARYVIECSAGTYIRSLISDLGDAYCEELRREAIGPFDVKRASHPSLPLASNLDWALPIMSQDDALMILEDS